MKIDYYEILRDNMVNVLRDVLKIIEKDGLKQGHHLYISFKTGKKNAVLPNWLKDKFPKEMTIIIQYEYWNFQVLDDNFKITLSFDDIKSNLVIPFNSVISFADPYANFGLRLIEDKKKYRQARNSSQVSENNEKELSKSNIIKFNEFKKKLR